MRVNAYILAADPAWVEASVLSYYAQVERIVVSYDAGSLGWTGKPVDVGQCLRRLRAIDLEGKLDFRPGHYARAENFDNPLVNDTYQRQTALAQATEGADWVLQLDTDEVVPSTDALWRWLSAASAAKAVAVSVPFRWLYCNAGRGWYVEQCRRLFRRAPHFHGPVAVRPGTKLDYARRVDGSHYCLEVDRGFTSPWYAACSDDQWSQIADRECIYHFSFVRSEAWLRRKFQTWGHAKDRDWHPEVERWLRAVRHPWLASVRSQLERGPAKRHLRPVCLPPRVNELARLCAPDGSERVAEDERA